MKSPTKSRKATIRKASIEAFRRAVLSHYEQNGRNDLPWRKTTHPYRTMVSEMMLQQTQVLRVIIKYKEFLRAFPTVQKLAAAPLSQVLRSWSGLGYNRRAKYLHEAAKMIVRDYSGRVPKAAEELERLPGIGHYTARAVAAFAYDTPGVFLETNIRTALIHHFFPDTIKVHDRELLSYAEECMKIATKREGAREWYSALMDYGTYLKAAEGNASRKSSGYKKQSKFAGSLRQTRGEIVRALQEGGKSVAALRKEVSKPEQLEPALAGLMKDGLVRLQGGMLTVA